MEIDILLIYGMKVGIEYVSSEDLAIPEEEDEEEVSHMVVLDLFLVRCCFIFFK